MNGHLQSEYFLRLKRVRLWPLVSIILIVGIASSAQIVVLYDYYVPGILEPYSGKLSSSELAILDDSIAKIVSGLYLWLVVSFIVNVACCYVIWNVRKFVNDVVTRGK